jgi:serine/threonine protein kinase/tetratricopeptide (TPR) repeat protein
LIGTELNHYKLIAALGAGGMGEVYLAEDKKLKRRIALKVLPPHMASAPEALARFRREAVAIAALNHPNIVTIHSIEESEGVHFLTMEVVDGKSLAELIVTGGMSLPALLDIAIPLARALAAAHERGITHRDLKPQNVMIANDGTVKILDFGLARFRPPVEGLDSAVATEARTQKGAIVGTFPYMSPEQAQGAGVDPPSDVFSVGVILYEMASGRRPFTGDNALAILSSILKDEPPSVEGLPTWLDAIIRRCLAKDPRERYQGGIELSQALARRDEGAPPGAPLARSDVPSISVRPFKTRAGDPELSEFADGLTEDVIAGLALFPHLSVIDEDSEGHRARFAIEGAVRKSGSCIRANVKLLDCASGSHLWAEQFDRDLVGGDVFAAQDALADRIVATVADSSGVLTRSLVALGKKKPASELTALDCVLRAYAYSWQWRPDEHAELRAALERAVEREPDDASAWACLALTYVDEDRKHYNPRSDSLERAMSAARRAVELDATSQLAYRALAEVYYSRRDVGAFRAAAARALMLNPRDTSNVGMVSVLLCYGGDWDYGTSIFKKAMAMNPHHAGWLYILEAFAHYREQAYDKSLEAAERINIPGYPGNHLLLAIANAQLGRDEAARRCVKDLLAVSPKYGKFARADLSKWFVSDEMVEHIIEGLRKAGLDIDD